MAECHPVGFQWVMEAKERGAKVIHVDPRFTRTSAMADLHVPLRAGSDIVFLGGADQLHPRERPRVPRVRRGTTPTRPAIISEDFQDTEDLDGLFSGFDPETRRVRPESWRYQDAGGEPRRQSEQTPTSRASRPHGAHGMTLPGGRPPHVDPTLRAPALRLPAPQAPLRAATRPRWSSEVCGVPREQFLAGRRGAVRQLGPRAHRRRSATRSAGRSTRSASRTSAPRRSSSCCSATSAAPAAASSPCAATPPSRARPTSRRSTTSCPGYIPMPHPQAHATLDGLRRARTARARAPGATLQSLHRQPAARPGAATRATAENDFCFDYLPRINGDHSHYADDAADARRGQCKGFFVVGQNPAVGSAERAAPAPGAGEARLAGRPRPRTRSRPRRSGTTARRSTPASCAPRTSPPRCSSCRPPRTPRRTAPSPTPSGCCSGTTRRSSRPATAARTCWFTYHLGRASARSSRGSTDPKDRPLLDLTWDYPTAGPARRAARRGGPAGDQRPQRRRHVRRRLPRAEGRRLDRRAAPGSTPASTPTASTSPRARKPRTEQNWVAPRVGLGLARRTARILYNRASADPDGKPVVGAQALRLVGRRARARGPASTTPDFTADKPPDYGPPEDAHGDGRARAATTPFIMQPDGLGWLFAPPGLVDGPLPDALRAARVAVRQPALRPAARTRPASASTAPTTRYNPTAGEPGAEVFPFVHHDLPADRAPHGRRHVAHRALPVRAAAGDVLRGQPGAGAPSAGSSTAAGRRSSPRARRSRRACWSPTGCSRCACRAAPSTRSALPYHWGAQRARHGRRRPTTCSRSRSTRTCTSRSTRPRPATSGPAAGRAARRCWRSSTSTAGGRG